MYSGHTCLHTYTDFQRLIFSQSKCSQPASSVCASGLTNLELQGLAEDGIPDLSVDRRIVLVVVLVPNQCQYIRRLSAEL